MERTERTFEAVLAEQCAPTLAGWKAASLFSWQGGEGALPRVWARRFAPYGIGLRVLKTCPRSGRSLLYLYRGRQLRELLAEEENAAFLARMGYHPERGCGFLLRELSDRLCLDREFPHEIGVFLGYPLEDVVGFMENRGENYTCRGCWKSYGDPEEAARRFARYRRCTQIYRQCADLGIPIMRLIMAA